MLLHITIVGRCASCDKGYKAHQDRENSCFNVFTDREFFQIMIRWIHGKGESSSRIDK